MIYSSITRRLHAYPEVDDEVDFLESLTVPGRAVDVKEALRRHRLGLPINAGDSENVSYDIEGEGNENDSDESFDSHMSFIKDEMDAIDFARDAGLALEQAQKAQEALRGQSKKLKQGEVEQVLKGE